MRVLESNIPLDRFILLKKGKKPIRIKKVLALSALYDLAVLETEESGEPYIAPRKAALKPEEPLFFSAYMRGNLRDIKKTGNIFYHTNPNTGALNMFDFPINYGSSQGSSGSPVMDKNGEAAGVIVMGGAQMAIAIAAAHLKDFIEGKTGTNCQGFSGLKACAEKEMENLKKSARLGKPLAQFHLGMSYFQGSFMIPKDKDKAFLWMEKAAKRGDNLAQIVLIQLKLMKGQLSPDFDPLQQAARAGYFVAQVILGVIYRESLSERDFDKSVYWLQKAARQNFPPAFGEMVYLYKMGWGVQRNVPKAVELLKKGIAMGCSSCMGYLGNMYREGLGVERDLGKAADLYMLAWREHFHHPSLAKYADMFKDLFGGAESFSEIMDQYEQAAETGQVPDPSELAGMTKTGAEYGYELALTNLGDMYLHGFGVERDAKKAAEMYKEAADQNFAPALKRLGDMYMEGLGSEKDQKKAGRLYEEAAQLYRKRADWGFAPFQFGLGDMYMEGLGVARDLEKAEYWHGEAAQQGYLPALSRQRQATVRGRCRRAIRRMFDRP